MKLDTDKYLHHLDGMDLSETEKIEFIHTLWLIAQCFVDAAYSAKADGPKSNVVELKSGFEAANVIEFPAVKQTRATAANDNASRAKKGPSTQRKEA